MSRSAQPTVPAETAALGQAALAVGAITAARLALLAFNRTDLFVDEAQYWAWGQTLAWGYFSKPPMIGWVLRLVTDVAGSDAAFWLRAPGAVFHGATALILGACAGRLFGGRAAFWTAVGYATLPMVALGSLLISTDTIMAPFYAAALWFWLRMAGEGGASAALACGVFAGLAIMSKYAGLYLPMTLALGAAVAPALRVRWRDAGLAALAALSVVSPNIAWNVANDLATLDHTMDNVDWVRDAPAARDAALNPGEMAEFFASQFAVFGPVLFGALLLAPFAAPRRDLVWLALPIVALICLQALLSRAYANWAVAAYFAGSLAVIPWLARAAPGWWRASLAVNGAICVALPLLTVFPYALRDGAGDPLLSRYLGRTAVSEAALALARAHGAQAIVAEHRDLLADLFHTGRDAGIPVFARPPDGRPEHFFAQEHALPPDMRGPFLWVGRDAPGDCRDAARFAALTVDGGAYDGWTITPLLLPQRCRDVLG